MVTHTDLRIDDEYLVSQFSGLTEVSSDDIIAVADFLNPVENPIVRSFESTLGKGLAGVITSMEFNWLDDGGPVWETDLGARAPKFCQVDMTFAPIHDIAPGLDSDGFNRAPSYPVGLSGKVADTDGEASYESAIRAIFKIFEDTVSQIPE